MKILLISANTVTSPYPVYPLGLDYVAGALDRRHQATILDMNQAAGDNEPATSIRALRPDLIGISLRNIDNTDGLDPLGFLEPCRGLLRQVRAVSSAPVVLGGSGFTLFPRECMRILKADYGIVGEGERLNLLLAALENHGDAAGLAGVILPDGLPNGPAAHAWTGQPPSAGMREAHAAAAAGAPPEPWPGALRRGFDAGRPHVGYYLRNGGMLNLQTKRGCPFHCVYCTYPRIEGRRLRLIDPDEAARTAVQLQQAGARYLFVTDSVFNADVDHSLAVARALRRAGLTIPWGAFIAPTQFPAGYFDVLAGCGLKHAEFGSESLCDSVLAAYRKPFDSARVRDAHAAAIAAGLHVAHYLLFGGPGETADTLEQTLQAAEGLTSAVFFIFCGMRIYPGTLLHELACRQGLITAGQHLLHPVFYEPPEIGRDQVLARVCRHAGGRSNWIVGSLDERTAKKLSKLHQWGYTGPLWETVIPR